MRAVWKVPWENRHKEVLWRLAVNGVAAAGGHNICHRQPCPCGYQLTEQQVRGKQGVLHRQHAFWDCPVAQAVRAQVQRGLGQEVLQQWQLWLLQKPHAGVRPVVWRVVGLAALEAMEVGRRYLFWRVGQGAVGDAAAVQEAGVRAVSAFWLALHDFVGPGGQCRGKGWEVVGPDHPFLRVQVQVPLAPRLSVAVPA
jgi:hypothetical protein